MNVPQQDASTRPAKKSSNYLWIIFATFFVAIILFTVYWFVASHYIKKGVLNWMSEQEAQGFQIQHQGVGIAGFPYRFELNVQSPKVTTPDTKWTWSTDRLQIVMQSYNFNHYIAYAPGKHIATDHLNKVTYTSQMDGFAASYSQSNSKVKRLSIVAKSMQSTAQSSKDGASESLSFINPHFHMSPMPDQADDMRLLIGFDTLSLSSPIPDAEFLGNDIGPLSAPIAIKQGMKLLEQGGPLDFLITQFDPAIVTPITQFKWGPLEVKAKTEGIKVDTAHKPAGMLNIRLENIPDLRNALEKAGKLDDEKKAALTLAEGMMKQEDAYLPINFTGGKVKILFQDVAELDPLY
ncbi:DUF2125 domain-containing protein [Hirschia litorea]|uniref:DUF2125 domain-containing protein n=1 Tax=Hirschia litorea TaxID=1199156 RepID=A0ABW2ILQ6_9PROT